MIKMPKKEVVEQSDKLNPRYTQKEIASHIGVNPAMLIYWEDQGLLHPRESQKAKQKRIRRYSSNDVQEIKFVKSLYDSGYTTKQIKNMLEGLKPPYNYDLSSMFWDIQSRKWVTLEELGTRYVIRSVLSNIKNTSKEEMLKHSINGATIVKQVESMITERVKEAMQMTTGDGFEAKAKKLGIFIESI